MKILVPNFSSSVDKINEYYTIGGSHRVMVSDYLYLEENLSNILINVVTNKYSDDVRNFISKWPEDDDGFIDIIKKIEEAVECHFVILRINRRVLGRSSLRPFPLDGCYKKAFNMSVGKGYLKVLKTLVTIDDYTNKYITAIPSVKYILNPIRSAENAGHIEVVNFLLNYINPNVGLQPNKRM